MQVQAADEPKGHDLRKIERIESSSLDQFIQIFEISFIFLLTFVLITLIDTALLEGNFYDPIVNLWLGERGVGNLDGGNWGEIVRITLLFNGMLFAFSLFFGLWMRRTRDGWKWSQLGFTFKPEGETGFSVAKKGIALGFLVIFIYYLLLSIAVYLGTGSFNEVLLVHSFNDGGTQYTSQQLLAEYYFGFIEMGFIWPMSAGFFFFAYTHNSLRARFPIGVANVLSTLFYVFYLLFFFMIPFRGKLALLPTMLMQPVLWANLITFFIILYISFSAFATTRSILLPFLLNFVLNVGLTTFKAFTALTFASDSLGQLIPFIFTGILLVIWFFVSPEDFSTIKSSFTQLKDREHMSLFKILQYFTVFLILAFVIPLIIEQAIYDLNILDPIVVPILFALMFELIIFLAILVLTYEPTKMYDVMLMTKGGLPIASRIKLFQSDKILISGFFSALASFNQELEAGATDLKSIKKGEREIIVEDGVFTRIIALVDKDQDSLRQQITKIHRDFEIDQGVILNEWMGNEFEPAQPYIDKISKLKVTFNMSQQAKWISILTLTFTPLMILLIGLL